MKTAGRPLGYNRQSCSEISDLARQPGTSGLSVRAADENGCGLVGVIAVRRWQAPT
jgi:hypothetical protein